MEYSKAYLNEFIYNINDKNCGFNREEPFVKKKKTGKNIMN